MSARGNVTLHHRAVANYSLSTLHSYLISLILSAVFRDSALRDDAQRRSLLSCSTNVSLLYSLVCQYVKDLCPEGLR